MTVKEVKLDTFDQDDENEQSFNSDEGIVSIEPDAIKIQVGNEQAHAKVKQDFGENDESFEIQVDDDDDADNNNVEDGAEDVPDTKVSQKQANTYAAKKTVAQGMMDIALITANANQLRYIIEFNKNSSTYYLNLVLITLSLFLQVGVGICLIFKGRMDLRGESKHRNAKRINNHVVVGIFLVTIINVFIASFTITGSKS